MSDEKKVDTVVLSAAEEKREKALAALDNADFTWFHVKMILVAGAGFFTDAYDIFVIGQALNILYAVYFNVPGSTSVKPATNIDALLKAITNWGNFIGQLSFGYLGDRLGRKRMYGVELMIIMFSCFASAFSASAVRGFGVLFVLGMWRFFLGIGIGGDYPVSAVISSEFSNVKFRGAMIAAVFANQGLGQLTGGVVALCTLAGFKDSIYNDQYMLDYVWRILLGFGVIPGAIAVYYRLTIPETPRFTVDVLGDAGKAEADVNKVLSLKGVNTVFTEDVVLTDEKIEEHVVSFGEFFSPTKNFRNFLELACCAFCWFALDVAYYGLTINSSSILALIGYGAVKGDVYMSFFNAALGNFLIIIMGAVPGYFVTVFTCEIIGRKPIQLLGFGMLTIILAVLAGGFYPISAIPWLFCLLYGIAQFFFNFGPNTTTFMYPAEIFPTRYRSTAHGISAGVGKLGAILGVQVFTPFKDNIGFNNVLWLFTAFMALGFIATLPLPEPKRRRLEDIAKSVEKPSA
ncbi:hypothetical protein SmJEL517_g05770 [Synchytrium microbalum]|uniref:Major facilitator superfamily (MFS) profile domain-containing protein n=1 Tax=Synchytrium microbalum TaxID=1806994 RepID=A0A507BYC1_9FUNG|nr:uncharacterized protein SmJEL517_g05770 [Synchytrium microbalum]TPX30726.1 hypothetical protein SmJEL517_g05770 [Synchytrium microbalum]